MMLCCVVDIYQRLGETCFLHFQGKKVTHLPLMTKTLHGDNKPDFSCRFSHCQENLKSLCLMSICMILYGLRFYYYYY
jgi:hypothetical protein